MRLRFVFFFLAAPIALFHSADAQPTAQSRRDARQNAANATTAVPSPYVITGVVINRSTGDPVQHCRLTATQAVRGGAGNRQFPAPGGNRQFSANSFDCDSHGHFTVPVPSAGSWRLVASASGYVSQAYDEHQQFSSAIVLTAEAPKQDLQFRISPESSITGVVLDEAGEPVRNAQISLQNVPPPAPGGPQPVATTRGSARTDDRGMYELANLAPGNYRLSVHAQPWYATTAQQPRGSDTTASYPDPSLDFAYALTWFPGVDDAAQAEIITLRAGDKRQADFHLIPIPSIHLRLVAPARAAGPQNAPPSQAIPLIQRMNTGAGDPGFVQTSLRFDAQGQIDVGGLTPGLYQIRLAGPNQENRVAMVEVTANSARTVDLSAPSREMARITLHVDGIADTDSDSRPEHNGGLQVTLIDTDTQRGRFFSNSAGPGMITLGRRGPRDPNADRVIEVPPGRYEVVLQGRPNIFLTGLTAKGAETAGRYVTVGAGESTLTVHAASGRASLSGRATIDGKASVGAMILLVPVTIEDPNSITMLRQDQTNTDGSFDLANIIPGQYILVAIDHGWQINWGDRSTLRRYLMQGVPVDLKSSAIVKQDVPAQAP